MLKLANHFYSISKVSSLKTDLANRILYESLSSIYPDEVSNDMVILDTAIQGAKSLITYGLLICKRELIHCHLYNLRDHIIEETLSLPKLSVDSLPNYIDIFDELQRIFNNNNGWNSGYGGALWAKIAETLKNISNNYYKYLTYKGKDKINAAKQTLIYMNVYDGLAHNTENVYPKMLTEENIKIYNNSFYANDYFSEELKKIKLLQNAKELKSPFNTLQIAEKNIALPLQFKDYLQKARSSPEYNDALLKDVGDELKFITIIRLINQSVDNRAASLRREISKLSSIALAIYTNTENSRNESSLVPNNEINFYKLKNIISNVCKFPGFEILSNLDTLQEIDPNINALNEIINYNEELRNILPKVFDTADKLHSEFQFALSFDNLTLKEPKMNEAKNNFKKFYNSLMIPVINKRIDMINKIIDFVNGKEYVRPIIETL